MKYKVGDKFVLEIKAVKKGFNPYFYTEDMSVCEEFLDRLQQLKDDEPTMTAEEAWETSKQIMFDEKFSIAELEEIFGTRNHFAIMRDHTPQEAKAKIEAWEKAKAEKEEIKVGDVLASKSSGIKGVVTHVWKDVIHLVFSSGICSCHKKEGFEKTGERIDIEPILKQLQPVSDAVAKDHAEHFWEHRG